ncbi:hypothetical protein SNEBB_000494 [Seison nebaliae]|nr:hypothetical protein SNEBB_000494 [Seison nebaliae]
MSQEKKECPMPKPICKVISMCVKCAPYVGVACYFPLSIHVICPPSFDRLFGSYGGTMANVLLFGSNLGLMAYIAGRPHMKAINDGKCGCNRKTLTMSLFTSTMFTFGSMLAWATARSATSATCKVTGRAIKGGGGCPVKIGIATGSAFLFLYTGRYYLNQMDSLVEKK